MKEYVERLLSDAGIKRNSKNENDYEQAKRIFQKQKLTPEAYEERIRIACAYIGI